MSAASDVAVVWYVVCDMGRSVERVSSCVCREAYCCARLQLLNSTASANKRVMEEATLSNDEEEEEMR